MAADETPGSFMSAVETGLKILDLSYLRSMGSHIGNWGPDHRKITHGTGMHVRAHFEWEPNPYTGMFQKADNCIVRIANAADPGGITMSSYGPNMAIKCLRDGEAEAANLQTIFEIDGYAKFPPGKSHSCSYFEGPLVNHCAWRDDIPVSLKAFTEVFDQVSDRPMMLGVSQMATSDQAGMDSSTHNFPYALIFQPNPELNKLACEFNDVHSQLRLVPSNVTLYKVYAAHDPGSPHSLQYLGRLVTDSKFIESLFGDHQLFFRHTFFADEISTLDKVDTWRANLWSTFTDPKTDYGMANQKVAGQGLYGAFLPKF